MAAPLHPYKGTERNIVFGIDIGTTYSGVSYTILNPGEVPRIHGVTRFPGQENAAGNSKIPSVLWYNPDGSVNCVGAEATMPGVEMDAAEGGLVFVEWFKLHLRQRRLDTQDGGLRRRLPPLPKGKTAVDVFSDYLRYLFGCTLNFIFDSHTNGKSLWDSVQNRAEFVLAHPNGWEGLQQGQMRDAAIAAGLIPDTAAGRERVHFVTEGEASLNFCLRTGLMDGVLKAGETVIIVDAGGGTIDISSYTFTSVAPLRVEEAVPADCIVQGSTQVDARALEFLRKRLRTSKYGNEDDIKSIVDSFAKSAKPVFKEVNEISYIKFGSMSCNDPKVNIRRGQLMLSGKEMQSFFQPSLDYMINIIIKQRHAAKREHLATAVFLVGGFAASPFLHSVVQKQLELRQLQLFRPDGHTNKAVAEGAISFFLDHFVSTRVMRVTYGTEVCVKYQADDPTHNARRAQKRAQPSGEIVLPSAFSVMLQRATRMREGEEIAFTYYKEAKESRNLDTVAADILCYYGKKINPKWSDVHPEMFSPLCTVYADTSAVRRSPKLGADGVYYVQEFDIVFVCGLTELRAHISWKEKGVKKSGPAKIIYDTASHVASK